MTAIRLSNHEVVILILQVTALLAQFQLTCAIFILSLKLTIYCLISY